MDVAALSPLARYAILGAGWSFLLLLAVIGLRILLVKDETDGPTIAEQKKASWR